MTLIKKSILGDVSGQIYESLPAGSTIEKIMNENYELVSPDRLFKVLNKNEIIYTLEGSDLESALNTKTIIVPENIDEIKVGEDASIKEEKIKFGSNLPRIILIATALLVIILIVYFGLFFKGGLLRKKAAVSYFKNQKDYALVKTFILNCMKKNIKEDEIKTALNKKSWKPDQINSVLKEIKDQENKSKKIQRQEKYKKDK